jgi:hypothetical protein
MVPVHDQASGVDHAASDQTTEYPILRNDHMRDPVRHLPSGDQKRDQRQFEGKSPHSMASELVDAVKATSAHSEVWLPDALTAISYDMRL